MKFLGTDARLYKYPFEEQALIYAQRPGAPAPEIDYNTLSKKEKGRHQRQMVFLPEKIFIRKRRARHMELTYEEQGHYLAFLQLLKSVMRQIAFSWFVYIKIS